MIIRKAKPVDAKEISDLRRKTFNKINAKDYSKKHVEELNKKNTQKIILGKMKERDMFCITNNDKILGVIDLEDNKIGGLFIRCDYIGQGLGKRLMNFIEDYAKKKGIKKTILYSTKYAEMFYKKLGYKLIHKKQIDKGNGESYLEIKMEKTLK